MVTDKISIQNLIAVRRYPIKKSASTIISYAVGIIDKNYDLTESGYSYKTSSSRW